jgi:hypothetical protein
MLRATSNRDRSRVLRLAAGLVLLAAPVGCGAQPATESTTTADVTYFRGAAKSEMPPPSTAPAAEAAAARAAPPGMMVADGSTSMMGMMGAAQAPAAPADSPFAGEAPPPAAATAGLARKIIYNADLGLVVEDFARAEPEVTRLVQRYQGYIAEMQVLGSPGSRRSARWKVRVPVDTFEAFLLDVARLGELERNTRTSQDVSEEFYDIEARVKNKQVEEAQLLKLLEERTGRLEDVLKVEAELSRVRGEIEQLQGRLRVLANLTALTSVTIDVREREKFQPPPPVAANFPTRVARTFRDSLGRLIEFGEAVVLLVVDWVLWIPLLLLGLLVSWLLGRWVVRLLTRNGRRLWEVARTPIGVATPPPPPGGGTTTPA